MPQHPDDSSMTVPPWTEDEVKSLNEYQTAGEVHPFTCVNTTIPTHAGDGRLVATAGGWRCSDPACQYHQEWAWSWMADGSWKQLVPPF
jgi:hypothetical protein